MRSGKQKRAESKLENSGTTYSISHISRSCGQILIRIAPVDSTQQLISRSSIFIKILQEIRELLQDEHEVHEFHKLNGLSSFFFSTPHIKNM